MSSHKSSAILKIKIGRRHVDVILSESDDIFSIAFTQHVSDDVYGGKK
jgi:hypothetical protein